MTALPARPIRKALFAAALAALAVAAAFGGPLDPPQGPIAPTGKPIAEIESRVAVNATNTPGDPTSLYRITQPGSYYLTGNLQGVSGKHGIAIACSGVTLDLNGFELFGITGAGASLDGVATTLTDVTNITVKNGSMRNWGGDGIDLSTSLAFNCHLSGLRASNNAGTGLNIGTACTVSNCSGSNNVGNGISVNAGCTVTGCAAYGNGLNGFNLGSASIITGCTSYFNILCGINTSNGCTVENNNCRINSTDGIKCSAACVIRANTCTSNGLGTTIGAGVHTTGTDNRIEANTCQGADTGIDVDTSGSLIIKNICTGNVNNWTIATGNAIGPIVTVATNASTITGSSAAASTLGTTDPFANFNY